MGVVCSFNPVNDEAVPTYRASSEADSVPLSDWIAQSGVSPSQADQVEAALQAAEQKHRDLVDVELTIDADSVTVDHASVSKRSALATLRGAVALTEESRAGLSKAEAVALVSPDDVEQLMHANFDGGSSDTVPVVATGLAASPGVGVGAVYFSADDAFEAFMRGESVILVSQETSPADIHGMEVSSGILTTKGGLASHAAVVARGWGIPAVVGVAALELADKSFSVGALEVLEGDVISLDGSSGEVRLGEVAVSGSEPPPELSTLLAWADEIRGDKAQIRANADNAKDAARARGFGAQGIGLCRTEHMFLGDRLPIIQRMILAETPDEESSALDSLSQLQQSDFVELLEAMDGLPVTVRLLDPPLHEFLPTIAEVAKAEVEPPGNAATERLLAAAATWQEVNPMLGTRGVRLAVLKPALYKMQTRALAEAVLERLGAGGDPQVEIMIPLVVDRSEIELVRMWIEAELDAVFTNAALHGAARSEAVDHRIQIGAMIETPRAALQAGEMSEVSDFFSFGTNDLTQMTFGFSRDDIESRLMSTYLDQGLLKSNPFHTLDSQGVGALVNYAVDACKAASSDNPDRKIKLGACGEHAGEPASISLLLAAGLDYVSCSPFRVPVSRLAAAHHFLSESTEQRRT